MSSLVEEQKQIDKLRESLAKFRKELRKQEKEILEGKKDAQKLLAKKTEIEKKLTEGEKARLVLDADLKNHLDNLLLIQPTQKEYKKTQEELSKYKEFEHNRAQKIEEVYKEERDRIFKIFAGALQDKDEFKSLFVKSNNTQRQSVSKWEAFKFAASHPGAIVRAALSADFIQDEVIKLTQIIRGQITEDPKDPSFFMRLLSDKALSGFLQKQKGDIEAVLDDIIPSAIPVIISEASRTEAAASTLSALKEQGIDSKYITTKLLPVVRGPIKDLLQNYDEFTGLIKLGFEAAQARAPQEKEVLLQRLMDNIPITRLLQTSRVGEFLSTEGELLSKIIPTLISTSPQMQQLSTQYHLPQELLIDSAKIVTTLSGIILSDIHVTENLLEAAKPLLADDTQRKMALSKDVKELVALDKALDTKILQSFGLMSDTILRPDIFSILTRTLPEMLSKHQESIATIISERLPGVIDGFYENAEVMASTSSISAHDIASVTIPLPLRLLKGVSPKLIKEAVPSVIKMADAALSSIQQAEAVELFDDIKILLNPAASPDTERKNLESKAFDKVVGSAIQIMTSQKMKDALTGSIVGIFTSPSFLEEFPKIVTNTTSYIPPAQKGMEKLGITQELMLKVMQEVASITPEAASVISKTTEVLLSKPKILQSLYTDFTKYSNGRSYSLSLLIGNLSTLAQDLGPIVAKDIPDLLKNNQNAINKIVGHITSTPLIKKQIEVLGLTSELVEMAISVGSGFAISAIPVVTKIAEDALKDSDGTAKLIQSALNANAASPDGKKKKILGFISEAFIFAKNHPDIRDTFKNDVPKLFQEHAEDLGLVIDEFLNKTIIGQKYNVRGQELLKIASKNLPKLTEITELYANHQYAKMIPKAIGLLFHKDVFVFVAKAIFTKKMPEKEKDISLKFKSGNKVEDSMKGNLDEALASIKKDLTTHVAPSNKHTKDARSQRAADPKDQSLSRG
ncbi:MAG: hypothetical protein V4485_03825 [Pseudomonadota bacterium]